MDKNDLISRSALKEEVNKKQVVGRFNVLNLIDNAPTVPNEYMRGYEAAEREYKRPKGKWENICTLPVIRKCSLCGVEQCGEQTIYDNFCPNCGADMRGGKEE